MYLTAEDYARVKLFAMPIPELPVTPNTRSKLSGIPAVLTQTGSIYGIHTLTNNRLLFTHSSFTSPNDVYVLRDTDTIDFTTPYSEDELNIDQLTRFTDPALSDKGLAAGEEFWFEGADRRLVHGWIFTPPGFVRGEEKKWPAILLIHGGKLFMTLRSSDKSGLTARPTRSRRRLGRHLVHSLESHRCV